MKLRLMVKLETSLVALASYDCAKWSFSKLLKKTLEVCVFFEEHMEQNVRGVYV